MEGQIKHARDYHDLLHMLLMMMMMMMMMMMIKTIIYGIY